MPVPPVPPVPPAPPARVVVLAGPSGSGKSRLAQRLGLPLVRLDDFYRSAGDPALPVIAEGPDAGTVDWDHPDSWLPDEAVAALAELCTTGTVAVPVYDIAHDGRCGTQRVDLGAERLVVAEGLFAPDVVAPLREAGLLAAAFCVRRPAPVTFWLRLQRDLRERRKPPLLLLRRGVVLMGQQRQVVAAAVARGCTAVSPREAATAVAGLRADR